MTISESSTSVEAPFVKNVVDRNHALLIVGLLYFAQGFPNGLITQALPALLRNYGYSTIVIGWSGILLTPWSFKWLWARWVNDHYASALGRSRSWIIPTQLLISAMFFLIGFFQPSPASSTQTIVIGMILFVMVVASATQDIATDGLAIRLFGKTQGHLVNSLQVSGVKLGAIFGGGGVLMIIGYLKWSQTFFILGIFSLLCAVIVIVFKENQYSSLVNLSKKNRADRSEIKSIKKMITSFIDHYRFFWSSKEMQAWLLILCTFKLLDGFASGMVKPFMVDIGIALKSIGLTATIIGGVASVLGGLFAGWLLHRVSLFLGMLIASFGLILCVAGNAIAASLFHQGRLPVNYIQDAVLVISVSEHFFSAMALVGVFSAAMRYSRHEHAGSDFTIQISLMMSVAGLGHVISGYIAHYLGYVSLFSISTLLGVLGLIPLFYWHNQLKSQSIFHAK